MTDQAQPLRDLKYQQDHFNQPKEASLKTIAVTSGKGGVGKTNICLNLGIALSKKNKRVVIMDADLNLGNLDVLLGLSPRYTLRNVLNGEKEMKDILVDGPHGIHVLPAGSGALELLDINGVDRRRIVQDFEQFSEHYDYLLIDTPAGLGNHVADFLSIADHVLVVTSPEPTAIIDAYAVIKLLHSRHFLANVQLVINFVKSEQEAETVYEKLNLVIQQFLKTTLKKWSYIHFDSDVRKAVVNQQPFFIQHPRGKASSCITNISDGILSHSSFPEAGQTSFYKKLLRTKNKSLGSAVDATVV